jgi:hypothetical protein
MKGLTVNEYAKENNMDRSTVFRHCASGKLNFYFDASTRMIVGPKETDAFLYNKKNALMEFEISEYRDEDFISKDKILCPHCASEYPSENLNRKKVLTCGTCKGVFTVSIEGVKSYTTTIKGERLTLNNQFPEEDI